MAYAIVKIRPEIYPNDGTFKRYIEAVIDGYSDLASLDALENWACGSKAKVTDGVEYIKSPSGFWKAPYEVKTIPIITLGTSPTYDGTEKTQSVTSVVVGETTLTLNTDYTIDGNKATEPGVYCLHIIGAGDYIGNVWAKEFTVSRISITKPTVSGTYTYNGSEQTVTLANYSGSTMTVTGNKQKNAGAYSAVVALKDKTHYMWNGGDDGDLTLSWTIAKATPTVTLGDDTLTVAVGESDTVTITTASDGVKSSSTSDAEKATSRIVTGGVSVTGVAAGSATITVSVAASDNYNAASATLAVTVSE